MSKKKPAKTSSAKKGKPKQSDLPKVASLSPLQFMKNPLAGFGRGSDEGDATEQAQQVMYDAWEASTPQRRVALAKKALEISVDCADAYVLLAEETAGSLEEAIDLYQKGVEAGERALGKKAFEEDVGYFWGLLETRPYMRARAGLAQSLWKAGKREEAVSHYWEMLRLNPNDNQGIRDLLMPCLLESGRTEEAEKLFEQYREDGMAVWRYSRALLDFRKHGDSPLADESLQAALAENRHVPAYLFGRKKMPRQLPGHYGFGDDNEAVLYVYGNKRAWEATSGALEWLAGKVK